MRTPSLGATLRRLAIPLLVLVLAAGGVLAWNTLLRRKVKAATRELRQSNRLLKDRERLLQAVMDSMPLMLFMKDAQRDFTFTLWNRKAETLLGVSREWMIGKTDYDLLAADQVPAFRAADKAVLESGQLLDIPEEVVHSPANGPVTLHTLKVPVPDEDGTPRYLLGLSEDISLLKRMESDVQRSRANLLEAQRMARMGSWEWDHQSFRSSEGLTDLLGGVFEDLSSFVAGFHPEEQEPLKLALTSLSNDQGEFQRDLRWGQGEGLRWMHLHAKRFDGRLMGTCQDITEQRDAEAAWCQTQKLEALGILAGGMAHDFNNLLSAVLGHLNLAQKDAGLGRSPVAHLDRMESAVLKASNLARQILAYSGRGEFMIRALDLTRLVRDMSHLLEVSHPKNVSLSLELADDLPLVEGDETQVQQVILNLVTNAAEAIGAHSGTIRLATWCEPLDEPSLMAGFPGQGLSPGSKVMLVVEDTGCGMPPDLLARIFEPFFTTKFSGRGLGLSALRGILQRHGAGIQVRSQPGEGTRFLLAFPAVAQASPVEAACNPLIERPRRTTTVLLADDEPELRMLGQEMLERMGHTVLVASDGQQAVECFRGSGVPIGLVLLDLTMPRMDGFAAFHQIRAVDPAVPVILCSGFAERELQHTDERVTPNAFLPKPFRMRDLEEVVQRVLDPDGAPST